jgi:hypothetical protein
MDFPGRKSARIGRAVPVLQDWKSVKSTEVGGGLSGRLPQFLPDEYFSSRRRPTSGICEDECDPPCCEEGVDAVTRYLISFPSAAMICPDEDLQPASDAFTRIAQEAKDADV